MTLLGKMVGKTVVNTENREKVALLLLSVDEILDNFSRVYY